MSKHAPPSVSELDYDAFERLILAAPKMYELLANLAAVCDSWAAKIISSYKKKLAELAVATPEHP